MLSSIYAECHKLALSDECHYAECHYAECHYAECHYAECHYSECQPAGCHGTAFAQWGSVLLWYM